MPVCATFQRPCAEILMVVAVVVVVVVVVMAGVVQLLMQEQTMTSLGRPQAKYATALTQRTPPTDAWDLGRSTAACDGGECCPRRERGRSEARDPQEDARNSRTS